jgi:hypothetical protein
VLDKTTADRRSPGGVAMGHPPLRTSVAGSDAAQRRTYTIKWRGIEAG